MTSRLVGWDVQVEKDESAREAVEARMQEAANDIAAAAGISPENALDLVREGLNSLELLATGADAEDVAEILGVELGEAAQIVARAQAAFAGPGELVPEAPVDVVEPAEDPEPAETESEPEAESKPEEAAPGEEDEVEEKPAAETEAEVAEEAPSN